MARSETLGSWGSFDEVFWIATEVFPAIAKLASRPAAILARFELPGRVGDLCLRSYGVVLEYAARKFCSSRDDGALTRGVRQLLAPLKTGRYTDPGLPGR